MQWQRGFFQAVHRFRFVQFWNVRGTNSFFFFFSMVLVAISLLDLDFLTMLCLCHLYWITATRSTQSAT